MTEQPGAEGLVLRSRTGRIALTATVGASAMASLDATIVNVALPRIGQDLGATVGQLQWVLTGYLLALASLVLLGGALGDRVRRRRVFVIGTTWFAAASLLCGLAPNVSVLIAARVLQGVGGGLLTPGSLAIIQASFRQDDRSAAVGAWSALGGVAAAAGPLVGGAIVGTAGWRWAFLLNVPVAAVVLTCASVAVPESRDTHARGRVDLIGAALATLGLGTLTWALTRAGSAGWADVLVLGGLVVSAAALATFVQHIRHAPAPLLPPNLFTNRAFTVVNLGTAFLYVPIGLAFFLVTYELQVVDGWSPFRAGLALLPATVLMLVLSPHSATLAERHGPVLQLAIGPVLTALGLVMLSGLGAEPSWWTDVLPGALVFGLGLAVFVAPLTATVMSSADADRVGVASAVNNAVARTASLVGLAVIPVVSGLTAAATERDVTTACTSALLISAGVVAIASPLMLVGLSRRASCGTTSRRLHCPVDGPPLQADTPSTPQLEAA